MNSYLADSGNRALRIMALRNAKELVLELQDGDDAFFARMEQVSLKHSEERCSVFASDEHRSPVHIHCALFSPLEYLSRYLRMVPFPLKSLLVL